MELLDCTFNLYSNIFGFVLHKLLLIIMPCFALIYYTKLTFILCFVRDHISFINEMKVLIQSDELAKDVASAESLFERHQEHKVSNTLSFSFSSLFSHN